MLDVIPKPKIPVLEPPEDDGSAISIDELEEPQNQQKDKLDPKLEEAFAGILGFICAMGLPEDIFSKKQEFYKEQAVNLGVVDNIWTVLKTYYPDAEMRPEIALVISLAMFGIIVYSDRKQTMSEYMKKKKQEEYKKQVAQLQKAKLNNQNQKNDKKQ